MNLEDTLKDVAIRLEFYGFSEFAEDEAGIKFNARKVHKAILLDLNRKTLPDELYEVYIDMVCGEYLHELYSLGKLDDYFPKDPDITSVGSVKVGDISVGINGAGTSPRVLFEGILDDMRRGTKYRYLFDILRRLIDVD